MRMRLRLRLRLRERERERERERTDQVCVEFVGHVLQIELGAVLGVVHVETHFDHRLRILGGQRVAHRRSATASRQACCEASPDGLLLTKGRLPPAACGVGIWFATWMPLIFPLFLSWMSCVIDHRRGVVRGREEPRFYLFMPLGQQSLLYKSRDCQGHNSPCWDCLARELESAHESSWHRSPTLTRMRARGGQANADDLLCVCVSWSCPPDSPSSSRSPRASPSPPLSPSLSSWAHAWWRAAL